MTVPQTSLEELLKRRAELVRKKHVDCRLSRAERSKLDLLDWKIDRIEYNQQRPALDRLESIVSEYEEFRDIVRELVSALKDNTD